MSREFPDIVDPWKVAEGKRLFQGTMPIGRMTRLEALLAPVGDERPGRKDAVFSAGFCFDIQGLVTIDVRVEAELPLVCQRSLQTYIERVNRRSLLAVIEDIAEQEELPEHYEPVLVEEKRLALADLVEEELLLAVPQVPRSPEAGELELSDDVSVETSPEKEREQTHRPFEGLAGLLKETADE
jgi:uncharacterized protein